MNKTNPYRRESLGPTYFFVALPNKKRAIAVAAAELRIEILTTAVRAFIEKAAGISKDLPLEKKDPDEIAFVASAINCLNSLKGDGKGPRLNIARFPTGATNYPKTSVEYNLQGEATELKENTKGTWEHIPLDGINAAQCVRNALKACLPKHDTKTGATIQKAMLTLSQVLTNKEEAIVFATRT